MSIVLSEEKYTKPHAGTISLLLLGEKAHPFHPFIHSPCVSGEEGTLAPKQASISLICMCISLSCILHLPSHISYLHTFCPAPSESCAASRRSLLDRIAQYSRRLDSARLSAKSGRKTKCCGVFSFWHVIRYSGFFHFF